MLVNWKSFALTGKFSVKKWKMAYAQIFRKLFSKTHSHKSNPPSACLHTTQTPQGSSDLLIEEIAMVTSRSGHLGFVDYSLSRPTWLRNGHLSFAVAGRTSWCSPLDLSLACKIQWDLSPWVWTPFVEAWTLIFLWFNFGSIVNGIRIGWNFCVAHGLDWFFWCVAMRNSDLNFGLIQMKKKKKKLASKFF